MEENFYGIVFCRTKLDADEVSKHLSDRGYKADAMHGDVSQDRREQILKSFKAKRTEVLVATDVAARGIDVQDLTHVINYSLPQDPESYVHRIGRTGRAGKSGTAITLITPVESRKLRVFERQAKAKLERQSIPSGQAMVELKKKKIVQTLNSMLANTSDIDQYKAMAKEMFAEANSEDLVAALLSLNHSASLDKRSYEKLKILNQEILQTSLVQQDSFLPLVKKTALQETLLVKW